MNSVPPLSSKESLGDSTEKSLNMITQKNEVLSNLTAKYNKSRIDINEIAGKTTFPCDNNVKIASKYTNKSSEDGHAIESSSLSTKHIILNSSEDEISDTDFPGLSLVALAAKHKTTQRNKIASYCPSKVREGTHIVDSTYRGSIHDKPKTVSEDDMLDDMFSDSEGTSLFDLVTTLNPQKVSTKSDNSGHNHDYMRTNCDVCTKNIQAKIGFTRGNTTKCSSSRKSCKSTLNQIEVKEMTSKFMAVNFSDDSDSDETFSLTRLALKHSKALCPAESGSADDVNLPKPKEILDIANYHRHHTKSESDGFSAGTQKSVGDLKKGFENETSSSLGNLRRNIESENTFQFSLGCSIPGSFKSNNSGSSLTSLCNFKVHDLNINTHNSFSDPDISFTVKNNKQPVNNTNVSLVVDDMQSFDAVDGDFRGINLSCAIKIPSNTTRTSESTMSEDSMDIVDEIETNQIVTLLDNLEIYEDITETDKIKSQQTSVQNQLQENCSYDASHILSVNLKLRTLKCSSFGKVVCRQWRSLQVPYIKKEKLKTNVKQFRFTTPSPCDIAAGFLERRHKVVSSDG